MNDRLDTHIHRHTHSVIANRWLLHRRNNGQWKALRRLCELCIGSFVAGAILGLGIWWMLK